MLPLPQEVGFQAVILLLVPGEIAEGYNRQSTGRVKTNRKAEDITEIKGSFLHLS